VHLDWLCTTAHGLIDTFRNNKPTRTHVSHLTPPSPPLIPFPFSFFFFFFSLFLLLQRCDSLPLLLLASGTHTLHPATHLNSNQTSNHVNHATTTPHTHIRFSLIFSFVSTSLFLFLAFYPSLSVSICFSSSFCIFSPPFCLCSSSGSDFSSSLSLFSLLSLLSFLLLFLTFSLHFTRTKVPTIHIIHFI
jgi:hypothetical protein